MSATHSQRTNKPVIGLLGGPGSGKSTAARAFEALGCGVIDADRIAREEIAKPKVVETLRAWWGDRVLDGQGNPDRAAIASIIFEDAAQRHRLEALLHPRVHARRDHLRDQLAADPAVTAIIEDCPLLLENHLEGVCDALIYVDAPREQRLARLMASRGWDAAELDRREKTQLPLDMKRSRADYVLDSSDGADLAGQTRHLLTVIHHANL